ncbi:MAG: acetyl-CoA carboxylase, carboxyltransferase subunit beta [Lachnospiraceae bacterium]|nr:acetyl-CoA carboxylase, carboxyltransferase subunit beta [Lachnospiraceae bacterium]
MMTHNLFLQRRKKLQKLEQLRKTGEIEEKILCPHCGHSVEKSKVKKNLKICPYCHYYYPLTPRERLRLLADEKSFREMKKNLTTRDPLNFPDYGEKLGQLQEKLGQQDAVVTGTIELGGIPVAVGVMDSRFLMGSMGTVVGEKVTALAEYAAREGLPLLLFTASGGARMQEGMFALMQMAKTAAAIERFKAQGGLYISCMTNPTTGGVSASFASLGDIMLAEPDALICFAGPRVIQQTIGEKLPEGFQRAQFLLEHGMLDMVVERREMKKTLHTLLKLHGYGG